MLKKIVLLALPIAAICLNQTAHASLPGFYISAGMVESFQKNSLDTTGFYDDSFNVGTPLSFSHSKPGFGGRIALGYQFNPNFAAELGWRGVPQTKFSGRKTLPNPGGNVKEGFRNYTGIIDHSFIDVVAKPIMPINDKFSVYGKAGIVYAMTTVKSSYENAYLSSLNFWQIGPNITANKSQNKFLPQIGAGVSYAVSPNVNIAADYTFIRSQQIIGPMHIGNTQLAMLSTQIYFG